jgi:hypothetical protein|tara:strand:+ start:1264 stop:1977 length:714 start_codon:yes stop_codon:yes gene_type:complete
MKKFLSIIIILPICFYLFIEFIGDRFIKNILQNNISSSLNREVSIEKLNIDYLSGEADAKGIKLLNKKFEGYLVNIESVKVNLDAFSIFSNNIIINDVLLKDISVNYYFDYAEQKIIDNVRSLQDDLTYRTSSSESNKYFNIQNLDVKNISLSILSPDFNIDKTFSLKDMSFNNIGNTKKSNDYKDTLKKVFNETVDTIKEKIINNNFLDKIQNFNTEDLEDKVKDKLKNKLKKLIN